jgi:hypothetical protein
MVDSIADMNRSGSAVPKRRWDRRCNIGESIVLGPRNQYIKVNDHDDTFIIY